MGVLHEMALESFDLGLEMDLRSYFAFTNHRDTKSEEAMNTLVLFVYQLWLILGVITLILGVFT